MACMSMTTGSSSCFWKQTLLAEEFLSRKGGVGNTASQVPMPSVTESQDLLLFVLDCVVVLGTSKRVLFQLCLLRWKSCGLFLTEFHNTPHFLTQSQHLDLGTQSSSSYSQSWNKNIAWQEQRVLSWWLVAKTPYSQCTGSKFDPWSANQTLHVTMKMQDPGATTKTQWSQKKKKKSKSALTHR